MNAAPVGQERYRFPPPDHRPLGLALLSVLAEPAPGRRVAAGARHCRVLRNNPRLGKEVRPAHTRRLRRKKPSGSDVRHPDEAVITIAGRKHWLWRAVDQDGYVLAARHAACRTPISQGPGQPSREFSCAAVKTGADMQGSRSPGGLKRFVSVFSAVRNLLVPPRSQRSAFQSHVHRNQAIAEWKAVGRGHGIIPSLDDRNL